MTRIGPPFASNSTPIPNLVLDNLNHFTWDHLMTLLVIYRMNYFGGERLPRPTTENIKAHINHNEANIPINDEQLQDALNDLTDMDYIYDDAGAWRPTFMRGDDD